MPNMEFMYSKSPINRWFWEREKAAVNRGSPWKSSDYFKGRGQYLLFIVSNSTECHLRFSEWNILFQSYRILKPQKYMQLHSARELWSRFPKHQLQNLRSFWDEVFKLNIYVLGVNAKLLIDQIFDRILIGFWNFEILIFDNFWYFRKTTSLPPPPSGPLN